MYSLSKEKLEFFKFRKKYTNQKISTLTGIPISNVDKIFSGYNKNPTFETISKIAAVLDCAIDDFIEDDEPLSKYYTDKILAKTTKEIYENILLKELLVNAQNLSEEDLKLVNALVSKLSNVNSRQSYL